MRTIANPNIPFDNDVEISDVYCCGVIDIHDLHRLVLSTNQLHANDVAFA
jgi:hypothetical protein